MGHLLLVEPFESTIRPTGIFVGIRTLPVFEVESRLWQIVKRIVHFRRRSRILLVLFISCRLGLLLGLGCRSRSRLGLLLLFWRGHILQSLLNELDGFKDTLELGLVYHSFKVTDKVRMLGAEGGIESNGGGNLDKDSNHNVSQRDAFADKEGS